LPVAPACPSATAPPFTSTSSSFTTQALRQIHFYHIAHPPRRQTHSIKLPPLQALTHNSRSEQPYLGKPSRGGLGKPHPSLRLNFAGTWRAMVGPRVQFQRNRRTVRTGDGGTDLVFLKLGQPNL
jgi:hypothetical protein